MNSEKNFYLNLLGLKVEVYQPNPERDSNDTGDCIIRAFCKFLDKDWDSVFNDLSKIAFKQKLIFNHPDVINKYAEIYNYTYTLCRRKKMTAGEFMYNHKFGKYIIGIPNHAFAYIDGIIYDSSNNCSLIDVGLLRDILFYISPTSIITLPGGKNDYL